MMKLQTLHRSRVISIIP